MAIQFLKMVEVVLNPNGLVVTTQAVNNNSPFAWHLIEQPRQIGEVWEVARDVHDKNREVEVFNVERIWQSGDFGARFTEDRSLMTQLRGHLHVLRNRVSAPREPC